MLAAGKFLNRVTLHDSLFCDRQRCDNVLTTIFCYPHQSRPHLTAFLILHDEQLAGFISSLELSRNLNYILCSSFDFSQNLTHVHILNYLPQKRLEIKVFCFRCDVQHLAALYDFFLRICLNRKIVRCQIQFIHSVPSILFYIHIITCFFREGSTLR